MESKIRAVVAILIAAAAPFGAWAEGSATLPAAAAVSLTALVAALHNWFTDTPRAGSSGGAGGGVDGGTPK